MTITFYLLIPFPVRTEKRSVTCETGGKVRIGAERRVTHLSEPLHPEAKVSVQLL